MNPIIKEMERRPEWWLETVRGRPQLFPAVGLWGSFWPLIIRQKIDWKT